MSCGEATVRSWRRLYSGSVRASSFCTSTCVGMPPTFVHTSRWASRLLASQFRTCLAFAFTSAGLFLGTDHDHGSAHAMRPFRLCGPVGNPVNPTRSATFDFSLLRYVC